MNSRILNSIGLIVGIIGVVLIFLWGPPQPQLDTGISIGLEDGNFIKELGKTVGEHNIDILKRRDFHTFMSGLGLILIIIGFAFQLIATWIPARIPKQNREQLTVNAPDISKSIRAEQPSDINDSAEKNADDRK